MPAHDGARVAVDDEGDVGEARPGPDIREVRDPPLVRCRGGEVPIQQIRRTGGVPVRDRGAYPAATDPAPHAKHSHQPIHLPGRHDQPLIAQIRDHLQPPVHALGRACRGQQCIDDHSIRAIPRRRQTSLHGSVGSCGDLHVLRSQDDTDRLDRTTLGSLLVDESDDQRRRGSSSPAKKTAASFKIAFASRNSRFSRSSLRTRSDSLVVTPWR